MVNSKRARRVHKTECCLHLQLLDGKHSEWFYDGMAPLTGCEKYYMLQWADQSFCLQFPAFIAETINVSKHPQDLEAHIYQASGLLKPKTNTAFK